MSNRIRTVIRGGAALCVAAFAVHAFAQETTPLGRWRTVDDKTGKPRSIVEIFEDNGKIYGRVVASLNPATACAATSVRTSARTSPSSAC